MVICAPNGELADHPVHQLSPTTRNTTSRQGAEQNQAKDGKRAKGTQKIEVK